MNEPFVTNVWEAVVYLGLFVLIGWIVYLSSKSRKKG